MAKQNPCQEKHREFRDFAKTQGNLVCLIPKFPDSKDQGYCADCRKICIFSPQELNMSAKSVLHVKHSQITEIGTGKICDRKGKKLNMKIEI